MPSVVLALEPNADRVTGRFLPKVLSNALPGGITVMLGAIAVILCNKFFLTNLTDAQSQTVFIWVITFVGFLLLFKVSLPTKLSSWSSFFGISDLMKEREKAAQQAEKANMSDFDEQERKDSWQNGVAMQVIGTKDRKQKPKKEKKERKKHKINKSKMLIALNLFMYLLMVFIFVGVYFTSINVEVNGKTIDIVQIIRTFFNLDNHITWEMGKAMLAICAILTVLYVGFVAMMNQIKIEHGENIEKRFDRLDAKMRSKNMKLK